MPTQEKLLGELKVLKDKRERYYLSLNDMHVLIPHLNTDVTKKAQFVARLANLENVYSGFDHIVNRIHEVNSQLDEGPEKLTDAFTSASQFDTMYYDCKAAATALAPPVVPPTITLNSSVHERPVERNHRPNLPVVQIPPFDGEYDKFPAFKSLYDALIHSQPMLAPIEKFSYLKSLVVGTAANSIVSISFNPESYQVAYDTLVQKYTNQRVVSNHICSKLFSALSKPCTSDSQLHLFLDTFNVHVQALKNAYGGDLGDFLLLFMGLRLLDPMTRQAFENMQAQRNATPTYLDLLKFVQGRVTATELLHSSPPAKPTTYSTYTKPMSKPVPKRAFVASVPSSTFVGNTVQPPSSPTTNARLCACCSGTHRLVECSKFLSMSVPARYDLLKSKKLCFACWGPHPRTECKSKFVCRTCGSRNHHTLLHHVEKPPVSFPFPGSSSAPSNHTPVLPNSLSCTSVVSTATSTSQVLLGTALVKIYDSFNHPHDVRVLLDPGSMLTIMSSSLATRLALPQTSCSVQISGIGGGPPQCASGSVKCTLFSRCNVSSLNVEAVILPKISSNIPSLPVSSTVVQRLANIQLADPHFFKPSSVDLLLGAQYYAAILDPSEPTVVGEPSLIPTIFGSLVIGVASSSHSPEVTCQSFHVSTNPTDVSLDEQLKKFWELEDIKTTIPASDEDIQCENHFQQTHYREETGTYVVRLPFRIHPPPDLGNNVAHAMTRLVKLEHQFNRNPTLKTLYHENLQEYLDNDFMTVAPKPSSYVMTHHGVLKESSTTSKLRVVFSPAERASPSHPSLNDLLLVGPKLQNDINDILVSFRTHRVTLTADVRRMYLAIKLHPEDSAYQQILWRQDPSKPAQHFQINRVCFGVASSPFHALRVIKQLIKDEGHNFPKAAKVLEDNIYVDDVVVGCNSIPEARDLRQQLSGLLAAGGFELRKWSSSHPEVLDDLSLDLLDNPHPMGGTQTRILGIQYDSTEDVFSYHVSPIDTCITKRQVLSQIARIFDLPGFLGPVVVWMKILMQKLWLLGLGWDDPLPDDLLTDWNLFVQEFSSLKTLKIPRHVMDTYVHPPELIGFADASSIAYAAVVYLRVVCSDQRVLVNLIRAKTRVVPVKPVTIPRLELTACHLLASVIDSLAPLCKTLNIQTMYLFSDSTVALAWLKTPPHLLKTFVANRVVGILDLTLPSQWNHVPTDQNPADLGSRGCFPSQIVDNDLWWHGPAFLQSSIDDWPVQTSPSVSIDNVPELKTPPVVCAVAAAEPVDGSLLERFSSLSRAQRVLAWCLRFKRNCQLPAATRLSGPLKITELRHSEICMIKLTQRLHYADVFSAIEKKGKLPYSLASLSPFVSEDILRVGGRIDKSPLPYDARHPYLVSARSHLSILIVRHYHALSLHGGPKLVQHLIQAKFFIPSLRNLTRKVIFQCVPCYRFNAKPRQPYMAELPVSRFEQGRPFIHVGVDLAGPFILKDGQRRNAPLIKAYFAVFVCFSTKAVHLEALTSLSADCFLACFDRFVARRGLPRLVYSDQGTNFKSAARQLDETYQFLESSSDSISDHLAKHSIEWKFNTPANPSANGICEANVRSVKSHLRHVLKDRPLYLLEFITLLCRIEACLNSRPLGVPSNLPEDGIDCLTPGHFLIGGPLLARPEVDWSITPENRLPRWDLLSKVIQHFWSRWKNEYLHSLIQRQKWLNPSVEPKPGDMVLVTSEATSPLQWPLARVLQVFPNSSDNVSRVLSLKTASGVLERPVRKLLILPFCT
uniref:Integrase catalytic domain-containing protein n=1 Tax=Cacopsylla melanoneura TaxID=428564 RepID=A0A8D8WGD5_9HEMI